MTGPLSGLRILELSSFVASPLGGMTLAQLGADVIRVDPIGGGPDQARWPLAPNGKSLYWAGLNQGKRSITVNLGSDQGRDLVADLAVASGIVLTNARPRPRLTYDELSARRPDLIHVQLLGRRDGGAAVDYTVNASCGFPYLTGGEDHAGPVNHVLPAWDVATGLYLSVGILAADRLRSSTGQGQRLEIALADVALATAGNLGYLAEAQLSDAPRGRIGNQVYGDLGRDFATSDHGRVMVLVLTNRHWNDLLTATGLRDAITALETALDADFSTANDRYRHRELLCALLAPWFAARPAQQVRAALEATSVLWSPYRTFSDLAADGGARLAANPLIGKLAQPGIGSYLAPGLPLLFNGEQTLPSPAPQLGQDTAEVCRELLGLTDGQINDLHRRGTAGVTA